MIDIASPSDVIETRDEVLKLVREWRRMQAYAGHNELQAKLAQIGQAVDRYERTQ